MASTITNTPSSPGDSSAANNNADAIGANSETVSNSKNVIVEGSSRMVIPPTDDDSTVFYNPVQVQNRDLSVLMIALFSERKSKRAAAKHYRKTVLNKQDETKKLKDWKKKELVQEYQQTLDTTTALKDFPPQLTILDALAASGLRSMRYWKELPGRIQHIRINDLEEVAVDRAHGNVRENGLESVLVVAPPKTAEKESDTADEETTKFYSRTDGRHPTGITIEQGDAMHVMYMSRRERGLPKPTKLELQQHEQWDVIDLDPYGSAAPFLDAAVQAVTDGGMLNITCTDMTALGGAHAETCYGRYGSMPITRAPYLQESAIRNLLHTVAVTAARYGRTIRPVLSVGMNFYIRCFVEVFDDKAGVNNLSTQLGNIYQSTQSPSFVCIPHGQHKGKQGKNVWQPTRVPPTNEILGYNVTPSASSTSTDDAATGGGGHGGGIKVGGPIWVGPLHDDEVVQEALERLKTKQSAPGAAKNGDENEELTTQSPLPKHKFLATRERLIGLLTSVSEELKDVPLYYDLSSLCQTLSCPVPGLQKVQAALINAGYRVSGYHKCPQAIKTDAPNVVLWDIFRVWCKEHPPSTTSKKKEKRAKRRKLMKENERGVTLAVPDKESPSASSQDPAKAIVPQLTTAQRILQVEPITKIDFTIPNELVQRKRKRENIARFPANPEAYWGPKKAASGKRTTAKPAQKETSNGSSSAGIGATTSSTTT